MMAQTDIEPRCAFPNGDGTPCGYCPGDPPPAVPLMGDVEAPPIPPTPTNEAEPEGPSWGGDRSATGGSFILDVPDTVPAVWGEGESVLWAEGEPLLIVGPPGAGKTTLAQQVVLARMGLRDDVLGMPVEPSASRVLYLACDRPSQIARSFRRMVNDDDREQLDERLTVWRGPLPFDLMEEPKRLAEMCHYYEADTLAVDSMKDISPALETSEGGSRTNAAFQECMAEGIDVVGLHHQRKAQEANRKPTKLADVYGSVWITAGAGSVLLVWGEAGDPIVELSHLKMPVGQVGPWTLMHDHERGMTTVKDKPDPLAILRAAHDGVTAADMACMLYVTDDPTRAEKQKATRQLQRLEGDGLAHKKPGSKGGQGGSRPDTYYPIDNREEEGLQL